MEDWSYMKSLYAWFTTFTTIGFGDYIHLDSFARKAGRGEIPDYLVVLYGLTSCFPYIVGLTLVSCILGCLVDSVDINSPKILLRLCLRCLRQERAGYDIKIQKNSAFCNRGFASQQSVTANLRALITVKEWVHDCDSMISNMTFAEFSQKGRDQKCESCLYQNIRFFIYFMKKNAD
ncbi:hypothetical protein P5673_015769 [Acropora cervicornis]|uniref:Potassium channel domain-containing protein n=1 Tax=Acropora cervicornis TaxID=6130 RepID=A0AAD9V4U7_ACRCE|nr:hypothetical protein P5673_015769 [Acropora cervicornis]